MRKLLAALLYFTLSFTIHAATTPVDLTATYTQNYICAAPAAANGIPLLRPMVAGDLNTVVVPANNGGTGTASPTTHGILIAHGSSAVTPLVAGAGTVIQGQAGADPIATSTIELGLSGVQGNWKTYGATSGYTQFFPAATGTILLTGPSSSGTLIGTGDTATVTNAMLAGGIANSKTTATAAATASAIAARDTNANMTVNNLIENYSTTATAAGTTTLTVSSAFQQYFTGSTTQTVVLPVASTLVLGQQFQVINNSTGIVTVQSSGANTVQAMAGSSSAIFTCILTSGTTAASWGVQYSASIADTAHGGTGQSSFTAGDQTYYASGTALTKVGIGSQGKVWSSTGTAPGWIYLNPFVAKTGNYSIVAGDTNTHFQFSGGTFTGTLPTAAAGLVYIIENVDASNVLNIKTSAAGQLIDGTDCSTNAYILTKQYAKVTLMGVDATHWSVIACNGDWVQASNTAGLAQTFATTIELVHVTLSPGEWDLSGQITYFVGTLAGNISPAVAISTSTASISAGVGLGDNRVDCASPSASGNSSATIASYRIVVTGSTLFYLNSSVTGSSGSGSIVGRLSARRIR